MLKAGLAVLIACISVATSNAHAMPGDPPFGPTAPADGATATVNPDGIPVAFTCPGYRIADAGDGFITPGGPKAKFGTIKLAPDGSFVGVNTAGNDTMGMRVRGRLVKAKLTSGRIELSVGPCTGNISFQVKHA